MGASVGERFSVGVGLRQGWVLSQILTNIYIRLSNKRCECKGIEKGSGTSKKESMMKHIKLISSYLSMMMR